MVSSVYLQFSGEHVIVLVAELFGTGEWQQQIGQHVQFVQQPVVTRRVEANVL